MEDLYSLEGLNKRIEFENRELDRYLKDVIHEILPNQYFAGKSVVGDKFTPDLSISNKSFKDSQYFYNGDLHFIHYTNLKSFLNIINEDSLRLSDFNSLDDDPQEFVFALDNLYFTKSSLSANELKSCFNSISFCEYDDNEKDSFDMWRLYGGNGKGVAFVFSIDDERDYWENFYLSKVYYGNEHIQSFKELDKKHKKYFETTSLTFHDHLFDQGKDRFPFQLFILPGFHKNSLYKIENEVRLLKAFNPFGFQKQNKFYSINRSYDPANYIKLQLKNRNVNEQEYLRKTAPQITIEKLILGYRFSEDDLEKIQKVVEDASVYKSDHIIKTELSHLKTYFK